jgi:two-component system sensor kinase FixL
MSNQAERLSAIINTTVDGIIVIDGHGLIESFNPAAERLFGYVEAEVVGRNVNVLMPSPFHEEHDGYLERYQRTGQAAIIGTGREVRGRRKDGTVFPLHLSVGEMVVNGERKFTGVVHDLTDRVKIEEQLRASEERWRAVIDSAIDGIIVISAKGIIESFNPAAARMFGYAEADVIGQNVKVLMPAPYHNQHDGYLAHYVSTGDARIIGKGRDVTGRRKDGSTFPLHLSVGETITQGERRFTGILHDLTARVELEERLRDQSALAKLGEMAAVIAHEVKNPLAGIRGVVQIIGKRLPQGSTDALMMHEIVSRIDSLDTMMKDLLQFSRPPKPSLAPVDIVALVQVTAELLSRDASAAHVAVDVQGSAPLVQADSEMLKMVIQNLLINAMHAINGTGRIRARVDVDGTWCRIQIADDGTGIPSEIREKIFVPFFTTKKRGTGLGLPTAKRFLDAHGGRILIDCPPSGGSVVTVLLPIS